MVEINNLGILKEKREVSVLKFNCRYSKIVLENMVEVKMNKLVLTSPYDENVYEYGMLSFHGYDIEPNNDGFTLLMYFYEPKDEGRIEEGINYKLAESFECNLEKSDISVKVNGEPVKLEWVLTLDEFLTVEKAIPLGDEEQLVLTTLGKIFDNDKLLLFFHNELTSKISKAKLKELAKIAKL